MYDMELYQISDRCVLEVQASSLSGFFVYLGLDVNVMAKTNKTPSDLGNQPITHSANVRWACCVEGALTAPRSWVQQRPALAQRTLRPLVLGTIMLCETRPPGG